MEKIKKIGEIECWCEEFEKEMLEFLENKAFFVRRVTEPGCSVTLEIYKETK